jgi:subtilisin-like proprotein convertase family protein
MRTVIFFLFLLFSGLNSYAQSFSGGTGSIVDFQTLSIPITVNGVSSTINQTNFGLEQVCIDITHPYAGDLTVRLISPNGTTVVLWTQVGGGSQNFTNTCLRADASSSLATAQAPFSGVFKPQGTLGNFNNGQNPNGTWTLQISDDGTGDEGFVNTCSLLFGTNPATIPIFEGSDIPLLVINTNGQSIPDEPKIEGTLKIVDNGPGILNFPTDPTLFYNGYIGIEQRGSSSSTFPQKSYGFKTRDALGVDLNASLLGMPDEHDWILYAPYNDKTCMRNILTYHLANKMGNYASRTKLCELIVNNEYDGIYVLMEKIKRDNNRVNISRLEPIDNEGDQLTGGYIVKIDKSTGSSVESWTSSFPASTGQAINFQYHYPEADDITVQQRDYIQKYIDSFEVAINATTFQDPINGYRKYANTETFVDFFLINELSKNVDGYRLSTFLHKDKYSQDGRLRMGPVWDFNLAWWNADYCAGNEYVGYAYEFNNICGGDSWVIPTWWSRLMQDPNFQKEVRCRYNTLRETIFSETYLNAFVDSVGTYLSSAKDRHFEKWPILGVYTWPNPSPLPTSYAEELDALKLWIQNRLNWLDTNLPGICDLSITENELNQQAIVVYPNPSTSELHVRIYLDDEIKEIQLLNLSGELIRVITSNSSNQLIDVSDLSQGTYLLHIQTSSRAIHKHFVKM